MTRNRITTAGDDVPGRQQRILVERSEVGTHIFLREVVDHAGALTELLLTKGGVRRGRKGVGEQRYG